MVKNIIEVGALVSTARPGKKDPSQKKIDGSPCIAITELNKALQEVQTWYINNHLTTEAEASDRYRKKAYLIGMTMDGKLT